MATLNLADLQGNGNSENVPADDKGTFNAPDLTMTITGPDGEVVGQAVLEARAFTAKPDKVGRMLGGIGWYANVRKGDGLRFRKLALTGGFRVSVDRLKIAPGDTVDIMGADPVATEGSVDE